jgi:hypothetical protein
MSATRLVSNTATSISSSVYPVGPRHKGVRPTPVAPSCNRREPTAWI